MYLGTSTVIAVTSTVVGLILLAVIITFGVIECRKIDKQKKEELARIMERQTVKFTPSVINEKAFVYTRSVPFEPLPDCNNPFARDVVKPHKRYRVVTQDEIDRREEEQREEELRRLQEEEERKEEEYWEEKKKEEEEWWDEFLDQPYYRKDYYDLF